MANSDFINKIAILDSEYRELQAKRDTAMEVLHVIQTALDAKEREINDFLEQSAHPA